MEEKCGIVPCTSHRKDQEATEGPAMHIVTVDLGENEALLFKQVDSGIKCSCSWAGLKLDATVEVKGTSHTFPLLLAHCRTDVHRQKVYNVIMCSVAQNYCFCLC